MDFFYSEKFNRKGFLSLVKGEILTTFGKKIILFYQVKFHTPSSIIKDFG